MEPIRRVGLIWQLRASRNETKRLQKRFEKLGKKRCTHDWPREIGLCTSNYFFVRAMRYLLLYLLHSIFCVRYYCAQCFLACVIIVHNVFLCSFFSSAHNLQRSTTGLVNFVSFCLCARYLLSSALHFCVRYYCAQYFLACAFLLCIPVPICCPHIYCKHTYIVNIILAADQLQQCKRRRCPQLRKSRCLWQGNKFANVLEHVAKMS